MEFFICIKKMHLQRMNTNHLSTLLLIVTLTFASQKAHGQDFQFSQFYNVPLYQNPAFAGSLHQTRITAEQRLQWPRLNARYTTSLISADTYFAKFNMGIGGLIMQDYQGGSQISSTQAQFMYSYELKLSKQLTFRAGLQAGYVSSNVGYSALRFPSQFDNQNGLISSSNSYGDTSAWKKVKSYGDFSSGGLLYSKRFWAGFAVHHMNTPNQSFAAGPGIISTLPAEFAVTSGYQILLKKKVSMHHDKQEITITPTFHYKQQGRSNQLDLGVYGAANQFLVGIWYRGIPVIRYDNLPNNEAVIFFIGWKGDPLRIGYSYDFTISRLARAGTGGAHEINLTYVFPKRHRKRIMRTLPCPSF